MAATVLPHILAGINLATVATLTVGYRYIRNGNREAHRKCMLFATLLGAAFLVCYLAYHLGAGLAKFGGAGMIRPIYFTILVTHIIMAAIATPLVPYTIYKGWSGQYAAHKRIAPLAWKIWMFVAVSGLVVYVMTIHIWPYTGAPA